MPRKPKTAGADSAALPPISFGRLDQLVTGPMTPSSIEAVMRGFKKILTARARVAEMNHPLGYSPGSAKPSEASNHRYGTRS